MGQYKGIITGNAEPTPAQGWFIFTWGEEGVEFYRYLGSFIIFMGIMVDNPALGSTLDLEGYLPQFLPCIYKNTIVYAHLSMYGIYIIIIHTYTK